MRAQHRKLQADLGAILAIAESDQEDRGARIVELSHVFSADLQEHLSVEDGTFYPDYVGCIESAGGDTAPVYEFIAAMKKIGDAVSGFFSTYTDAHAIDGSIDVFVAELKSIIDTLNIRIETEEEGVYSIYVLMEENCRAR